MKQILESILYTVNNSVGVHLETSFLFKITDICYAFVWYSALSAVLFREAGGQQVFG